MKNYDTPIAVSGTHGKTTTTSMISEILLQANTDPTLSIGGILKSIHGNIRVGHSGLFVAEACEYTNSFLSCLLYTSRMPYFPAENPIFRGYGLPSEYVRTTE